MDSIKWCNSKGLKLIEKDDNSSRSYIERAKETLNLIKKVQESDIWSATMIYYSEYYCLLSILKKIGIRSEIHKCSIEFMKIYLSDYYSKEDINSIESAFDIRKDMQYYLDKRVNEIEIKKLKESAILFYVKTVDILSKITEERIGSIRERFEQDIIL